MIDQIEIHFPNAKLTNEQLVDEIPSTTWTPNGIYEKTGIKSRFVVAPGETSLDLGYHAANKLIAKHGRTGDIDFLLSCTQFPDYPLPTNSSLLHARLGLKTSCGTLDYAHACSGYVYGLFTAQALLRNGSFQAVLLVTADSYTRHLAQSDIALRTLFGDAASATLLSKSSVNELSDFHFGTDGTLADALICPHGGEREFAEVEVSVLGMEKPFIRMNGPEVFNFTLRRVPEIVDSILQSSGLTHGEVDFYVFHQANAFMLQHLRRKMSIPAEKFVQDLECYGNTVATTIPIALNTMINATKLKPGMKIMLVGFGVGLSWGGCILEWNREL